MKKLRLIQVGLGEMGNAWIKIVQASPLVNYAGFVEVNRATIARRVRQHGFDANLVFPTLNLALAATSADGVLIVTPPDTHEAIARQAVDRGLPVLSEKPLAGSLESAEAIVTRVAETGALYMVAQDYRYTRHVQTVKSLLDSGKMGPVGSVSIEFEKAHIARGFHQQLSHPLMVDMTIHHFDLLRFFLGLEPGSIMARMWSPPWNWYNGACAAHASMTLPGDTAVIYQGDWCATGQETTWTGTWRFDCLKGVILMKDDRIYIQKRQIEPVEEDGHPRIIFEEPERVPLIQMPRVRQAYLLQEFYEAVTKGTIPATMVADNIKSLRLVFAAIESGRLGRTLDLEAGKWK